MNNSGASESTEIDSQVSNTQQTSGVATSKRNYDQMVQDIENQNMQEVAVEVDPPIVIGTSFNKQQHPVQDIDNPNLEEFDGAPPNFVQQQHTVQDNDPNQNWEGVAAASPSSILQLPNTIQDDGSQTWEAPPSVIIQPSDTIQANGGQTSETQQINFSEGEGTARPSDLDLDLMSRAAEEGDWAKADKLLEKDPTLAYRQDRRGRTPLHVSVESKHHKFALKLIERMRPQDLELEDSNELTACGYAAASGSLDIAKVMIIKNPTLACNSLKLVFSAFLSGKSEVVSFFLELAGVDSWWEEVWLEVLQKAIDSKMNDVALKILENFGNLATMFNHKGTALHVLARQDISAATTGRTALIFQSVFGTTFKGRRRGEEKMQPDLLLLTRKLLGKIKDEMDEDSALLLLRNPPILHDVVKVGNIKLIDMLTRAYPALIWNTDDKSRSLIAIAIMYRKTNLFPLIRRLGAFDTSCMFQTDENDNNLLHLAAYLEPGKNVIHSLQMQSELAWFKAMEAMLSPELMEEKNKDGKTPKELFVKEHEELLKESKAWMKSTADSCMLIATIILTVVYAAAFTVPGGNNEETGLPMLVKSNWMTCFFIFEALALFSSTLCIITFWSITCSGFEEYQFSDILRYQLRFGFTALFCSLIGATTAFLSAYHMVLVDGKAWFVKSILILIYGILVLAIYGRYRELLYKTNLPKPLPPIISNANRPAAGPYRRQT